MAGSPSTLVSPDAAPCQPLSVASGSVILWNADCRDVLPHLTNVDAVVTDPPYGYNYESNHVADTTTAEWMNKPIMGDEDTTLRDLVQGVGAFNSWDKIEKVVSVESLEIQQDFQLAAKFEELSSLVDGWYDGQGKAPAKEPLAKLASHMIGHFPETLALPAIVPTPEGNLLIEWDAEGDPSVDIDLGSMSASYHSFSLGGGETERVFDLNDDAMWPVFFEFLNANIESRLA